MKYTILFLLVILSACKSKVVEDKGYRLDLDSANVVNFEDYIEEVSCIKLPKNPLRSSWRIMEKDSLLYVYSLSDFGVAIFTSSGDFLRNITLQLPTSIFINEKDDELWVLDERRLINKYTLLGDFIEKIKLPFDGVDVTEYNDRYIFFDGGFERQSEYQLYQTTYSMNTFVKEQEFLKKTGSTPHTHIPPSLFARDNEHDRLYILPQMSHTIYEFNSQGEFLPAYFLRSDKHRILTRADTPSQGYSDKEMADIIKEGNAITGIHSFYYANGHLFFKPTHKNAHYYMLNVQENKLVKFKKLFEELDAQTPATSIQGSCNGSLYFMMSLQKVKEHYIRRGGVSKYPAINEILDSPSTQNADVIVKIKVKQL